MKKTVILIVCLIVFSCLCVISGSAETFKFMDEFYWGMPLNEVENAAKSFKNILEKNDVSSFRPKNISTSTVFLPKVTYLSWPQMETIITFYVHEKKGLYSITAERSLPNNNEEIKTYQQTGTFSDEKMKQIEKDYYKTKLDLSYLYDTPFADYSTKIGWLLSDATVVIFSVTNDKFSEGKLFEVTYKSPKYDDVLKIIELESKIQ